MPLTYQIRLSKVQRHKVQILAMEPVSHHLVDVEPPICLVGVVIESGLHLFDPDLLTPVLSGRAGEVQGAGLQALEEEREHMPRRCFMTGLEVQEL